MGFPPDMQRGGLATLSAVGSCGVRAYLRLCALRGAPSRALGIAPAGVLAEGLRE